MALTFNDESLKQAIASGKPVVVDFWATWCGPCRMIAPVVEALAADYEGRVLIGKYDVDEGTEMAAEYGVRNIPTLLFFKDGQLVQRHVGSTTRDTLEQIIKTLL
ncbi:MAG: thioredoxin [Muribaculaceae bacterium]|nr:thioredoxin [Muribaculaceae bacterium]